VWVKIAGKRILDRRNRIGKRQEKGFLEPCNFEDRGKGFG